MAKLFFYDLETTGLYPNSNGIHQLSYLIEVDGLVVEQGNMRIQPFPSDEIDEKALEVSGLTVEDIQLQGMPPQKAYAELIAVLSKYVDKYNRNDKFHLAGYNIASFDNPFFRAFFSKNGDSYFGSWFWADCIDVMVLASYACREKRSKLLNFKLGTVAEASGIQVVEESLHDALYDVYLTHLIYEKFRSKH